MTFCDVQQLSLVNPFKVVQLLKADPCHGMTALQAVGLAHFKQIRPGVPDPLEFFSDLLHPGEFAEFHLVFCPFIENFLHILDKSGKVALQMLDTQGVMYEKFRQYLRAHARARRKAPSF